MQTCPRERLVVKRNSGKGCETGNSGLTPCSGSGLGVFVAYLFACFCHQGCHSSLLWRTGTEEKQVSVCFILQDITREKCKNRLIWALWKAANSSPIFHPFPLKFLHSFDFFSFLLSINSLASRWFSSYPSAEASYFKPCWCSGLTLSVSAKPQGWNVGLIFSVSPFNSWVDQQEITDQ